MDSASACLIASDGTAELMGAAEVAATAQPPRSAMTRVCAPALRIAVAASAEQIRFVEPRAVAVLLQISVACRASAIAPPTVQGANAARILFAVSPAGVVWLLRAAEKMECAHAHRLVPAENAVMTVVGVHAVSAILVLVKFV